MKKITALAIIGAGFAAAPAMAQDDNTAPGGLHIGVIAGYEGLDLDAADGSATAEAGNAVYGITAGYDLSLGSAFIGVEGELSTSEGSTSFPDSFGGAREGLEANGQYYIGARAGLALTPGIAAYGKVGYTALDTSAFSDSGSLSDLDENADGFRFGYGLQVQLPGPLEGRIEYRRSKYKDLADIDQGDVTTDQLVAGLGLRF
ncbi:outer membrane protein [Erythrobacter aureus]|uniref:Porin family protein n=1 Tax=Erythrobacter aureus TaxID=2182384 RepID=A0A345YIR8_9SPHN|nr:outer membrane beta-barrel protein [Erythrobacter aureus]AXK43820.1 porin family protein [Erythrobacter aureus]